MGTTIFELNDFYRRRIELMLKLEILREDELGISDEVLKKNEVLEDMLGPDLTDVYGTLCIRKKGDSYRFFRIGNSQSNDEDYIKNGDPDLYRLAAKSIIEKLQEDVDNEIHFMNSRLNILNRRHLRLSRNQLSRTVSRIRVSIPNFEDEFLQALLQITDENQVRRMHDVMAFCKIHSEKNPKHRERCNKETKAGYWVRSKSEKGIANDLYDQNIPFLYEPHMVFEGIDFYPDFVLIRPDGSLVIWEHRGLDTPSYIEDGYEKLKIYNRNGYYMNNNLIYTYEHDMLRRSTIMKIIMRYYYVW